MTKTTLYPDQHEPWMPSTDLVYDGLDREDVESFLKHLAPYGHKSIYMAIQVSGTVIRCGLFDRIVSENTFF